ncbi:MAG: helicase-related protein [Candidatus Giovannonibacteria bacterium]|nr:helicase-related protein [Candidatus Giovannonibacteria bacterium]
MFFCQIFGSVEGLEKSLNKILIAAVIPSLLEKGAGWFTKNFSEIAKNRRENPFWRRNVFIFETGQNIKLSEFLRSVAELGYTKVWETARRGEFSQRGGTIHIFPINSENIFTIEFDGNFIEKILGKSFASSLKVKPTVQKLNFFLAGDYVVHIDHGIGVYRGLTQTATQTDADFIIEYAAPKNRPNSPDLLFVPKKEIKRISPYLGFKKPEIHRLGTLAWNLTKKKAKEDILAYAKELLEIFAKRKISARMPYAAHHELEEELISNFQYEYTPDQKKALEEIFADMSKNTPMDRVLVGDVGFGKTELAVLAAFRAVLGGKQVAIMAPTTILADQHFEIFKKRMDAFGVNISRLTRLESHEKIKEILKKIEDGRTDIVIGTHKILGVNFSAKGGPASGWKNLGLLIIDEEQKFGVAQKEKFKKENPALDILTLSATPIPRTLHLALSGIRAISEISTSPEGRMKIETFVLPKNRKLIKEAINFEIARGGQIYFLANRIHKIPALLEEIKNLQTGAKIGVLHGRMPEAKIIKTMHDFREGKSDILVSTTIIENGLDLSNVNTLIVEDATRLGLSQAHQLRGRIGRGDKEAFAYFLFTAQKLKERAAERLEALERYSWLGAGLEIAKRDLEIRGAGNILGRAQSGIAFRIGLNLYFELLEEAISEAKGFDKKT